MSKKNSILIILFISILIIGGLFYLYFFKNSTDNKAIDTTPTTEFPFGKTSGGSPDNTSDNNYNNVNNSNNQFGTTKEGEWGGYLKLKQIYQKPTSGTFLKTKNNQDSVRFVDRATGNIYEYLISDEKSDVSRLTNTTIPKIQESIWFGFGEKIILRYADNSNNIVSFLGKISTTSKDSIGEVVGNFLTINEKQVVVSPDNTTIFELLDKPNNGGSYGNTYSVATSSNKKQIFDSPLSIWNISWPKADIITFNTKPTYKDYGYLFFLNTKTYSFERILGEITGLTTNTNKDADLVAYSGSLNGFLGFDIYDVKNREDKNLKIKTLSDKCVWSNYNSKHIYCAVPKNISTGNYPDDWYQGSVSFNDDFWMIDTEEGTTKLIYENKEDNNLNIDAFDLKLNDTDKYLAFTNKNDLSLWLLDLKEETPTQQ
ncbi:MAG: hypothetical protein WC827_02865 [Candidatus Paceibacterota bacterium]|jgi:hypothetical protein